MQDVWARRQTRSGRAAWLWQAWAALPGSVAGRPDARCPAPRVLPEWRRWQSRSPRSGPAPRQAGRRA
eukprot:5816473-Alexandrium_andersonii.AAC.1